LNIIEDRLAPGGRPQICSDNHLINGKGNFSKAAEDNTTCTDNAGIANSN
jgi:hypothetical protein